MKHFIEEEDIDQLCAAAAQFIIKTAAKSIKKNGRFTFALSGGSTPKALFALMALPHHATQIDWKKTFVFWSDERKVPLNDEDNNAKMAIGALLSKVSIPKKNIFRIASNLSAEKAAKKYEENIRNFFGASKPSMDICLLGLGDDGHTASLFPATTILQEKKALVSNVHVPKLDTERISFTIPMILSSRNIVFFLSGKGKAKIFDIVITGAYEPEQYPAQFIQGKSKSIFYFYDKAAGKYLKKSLQTKSA